MNKHACTVLLVSALGAGVAGSSIAAPGLGRGIIAPQSQPSDRIGEELNIVTLEDRLRETNAINPWKKLELKGEINILLARFRHAHSDGASVSALRQPYEKLIRQIQTLLTRDPDLARDILTSKEAIWVVLADRTQFASLDAN